MNTAALEDLGLTKAEIRCYVALLELGTAKAGAVLKKTGLQNSVVHLTLGKLVEKGLLSFFKKGKVRYYQAKDPRNILRFVDEKRRQLDLLIPSLVAKQRPQERQEAEVFEGISGLKTMLYQVIEDAMSGDEYLFFSFYTPDEKAYDEVFEFYHEFEQDRLRRGLVVRGIAPKSIQPRLRGRAAGSILLVDFPTIQNLSIFRNKVIMTPWEDRQISFLITSSQLAENFRAYFYSIWHAASTAPRAL